MWQAKTGRANAGSGSDVAALASVGAWLRWTLGAAMLLASMSGSAHRGHAVWTDIVWNGESFEIVHRMHLADAINANRYMGGTLPIEDMRSLALVALYVEERFVLRDSDGGTIVPDTIGAEIEDDFILVYQEWLAPLPDTFPIIDNFILLDIEPQSQALMKINAPGISEERER